VLAALDPLRELDLLRRGEQRNLADVLEEELQRVRRDLGLRLDLDLGLVGRRVDDRDLRLVERRVDVVELCGLELQLVQRERELVGVELARAIPDLEEPLALVAREGLLDRRASGSALRFFCGQTAPLPRQPSHGSHASGGRQSSVKASRHSRAPIAGVDQAMGCRCEARLRGADGAQFETEPWVASSRAIRSP